MAQEIAVTQEPIPRPAQKNLGGNLVMEQMEFMEKGSFMKKVRGASKEYKRFYQLDPDHMAFCYTSKKSGIQKLFATSKGQLKKNHEGWVYISQIEEVREGDSTDCFVQANKRNKYDKECCFSVILQNHKSLDLVAEDTWASQQWMSGLRHLLSQLAQADMATKQELWLKRQFQAADKNGDGVLSFKEILWLLRQLNIEVNEEEARQQYEAWETAHAASGATSGGAEEADFQKDAKNKKGESCIDMDEFVQFYQLITKRVEITRIFQRHCARTQEEGKPLFWGPAQLRDFFVKDQKHDKTEAECIELINKHETCDDLKEKRLLSETGFAHLLNSQDCNVFNPEHRQVYQDMSQPLSHYWINSSHNTYLVGDQLSDDSAVEAYVRALKMGCRCVELDCWDGSGGEPVIYHGHTLTSKIKVKDTLEAIKGYAFEASEYPVILSIENHLSIEQQKTLAAYMREIFGDMLYDTPLPGIKELPSPEELKGKIIVKGKKLPESKDADGEVSDEDEASEIPPEKMQQVKKEEEEKEKQKQKKKSKLKLAPELSDCITICQSVSFKSFQNSFEAYNCKQMSSFSEPKTKDLCEKDPCGFIKLNKWQIARIYPDGLRVDSSNYDPVPPWTCGCQIVALNYQTMDDPMLINVGKFQDNGQSGYLIKPDFCREEDLTFNPDGPFPPEWKKTVDFRIISGYQLPKKKKDKSSSILDPFVSIYVFGIPMDTQQKKTKTIENNGFNPLWDETLQFEVNVPELAVVYIRVMDKVNSGEDKMVAQYALPFNSLAPGYRTVHLKSKTGDEIFGCSLLLNVAIR